MVLEFSKLSLFSRAVLCFRRAEARRPPTGAMKDEGYSTVTDFARFLGLSTSVPFTRAT